MKILFASSEAHPLVKTGGLADVSGALPRALRNLGHDVRLVIPGYQSVLEDNSNLKPVASLTLASARGSIRLLCGKLPESRVPLYVVDAPHYFNRPGNPYTGPDGNDWPDNAERFAAFARAVVAIALNRADLDWRPDMVHCNDWQTGLVPAFLSEFPARPATVFTIHNLAYQGLFSYGTFQALDLPAAWWSSEALEFYGQLSFIKGGIVFADWITTVSPTYADEIRTPAFGCGLDGLLKHRADKLTGILNGVDYKVWSPGSDKLIPHAYNARAISGKAKNKADLQSDLNLPQKPQLPLLAHIGRLVPQKGVDLILDVLPDLMDRRLQLVILGTGDSTLESALKSASHKYPDKLAVSLTYNEALAHRIEAGADMFLMPSRFEPCGLNQIYSLRYGTVPVVRRTGGLADTVTDANIESLQTATANGFRFEEPTAPALLDAIDRALALYPQTAVWRRLIAAGMRQDFSWKKSAQRYLDLYMNSPGIPKMSTDYGTKPVSETAGTSPRRLSLSSSV